MERQLVKILNNAGQYTEIYSDGLLISRAMDHSEIDAASLEKGKKDIELALPGKKVYVLSEKEGYFTITKEALKLAASAAYTTHIAAIAILVNHSATRFISELYLKLNRPPVPTRIFISRESALVWLESQMHETAQMTAE